MVKTIIYNKFKKKNVEERSIKQKKKFEVDKSN